jgi:hypothetical protein
MSPAIEPAGLAASAEAIRAAFHLEDGEVVLLAVKPSRWFVLLVSWPVVLAAAAITAGAYVLAGSVDWEVNTRAVGLVCTAAACTRVTFACLQWLGRQYILTNRRVMRLRGAFHEELTQCRLKDLVSVHLAISSPEHLLGTGSVLFERADQRPAGDLHWIHLADPKEVHRAVCEAWTRAR